MTRGTQEEGLQNRTPAEGGAMWRYKSGDKTPATWRASALAPLTTSLGRAAGGLAAGMTLNHSSQHASPGGPDDMAVACPVAS